MSYIERALYWFLKNKIFGGLQKLRQKEFLPFSIMIISIMTLNTILAVLYQLEVFVSLENVQAMLILELFLSFGVISSSLLIGKLKNKFLYYLIPSIVIAFFVIILLFFEFSYNQPFFQFTKLIYLFIWVSISSISFFFLTLYFFTSFTKKIITLGSPKEHIFFGLFIKITIYISIPFYLYMIYQFFPDSVFIGIFGIITTLIVFLLIKRAPKKIESVPGIINFATAVGFFYIFLFYHLVMSFSATSNSVNSLIIDILIFLISILYATQSLTRKISDSPARLKPFENPVRFQSRLYFTDHLKKALGERGVVLIVMGIALGYHMVYLDSFFITDIPVLSTFFTPGLKLSALYHRVYLIFSFIIIFIAYCSFNSSNQFKEFMIDKYTINQTLKFIGGYFKKSKDALSPFEYKMQELSKKIGENIKNWEDKLQKSIQKKMEDKFKIKEKTEENSQN